ncbi:MAG: S8 family serine peptidase [Firmicutes bacterium]|nr:S8 family serine peptidase [Bacillota bacterium]
MIGSLPLGGKDFASVKGLTGRGQIVGIADSGLDAGSTDDIHPDLRSAPGQMPKVAFLRSWAGRETPDDPIGHGTHMAATISGTGAGSGGRFKGIAPESSLYFQALLDKQERLSPPSDLRDLYEPAYLAGVRIHVNGWGGGSNAYGGEAAQIDTFVRRAPEFLPIFGAGNSGPAAGTLTEQANSKNALVVGSSQLPRPALSGDSQDADETAAYSSRGPTGDGRIKPELLVPGSAVVSACSREVESNFPPNTQYTRLGGTSMSAAVAGGSTALLREYLKEELKVTTPSSALIKAALINGARTSSDQGSFGVLDLEATVLALEERSFNLVDSKEGVANGAELSYKLVVTSPDSPLKATLTWVDPAAAAGSSRTLVNDLDLIVETPDGEKLLGNRFLNPNQSAADQVNNTEQVYLARPTPGTYTITVKGTAVNRNTVWGSPAASQDFALVYGQPLVSGTLKRVSDQGLELENGSTVKPASRTVILDTDGVLSTVGFTQLPAGSEVYIGQQKVYASVQTWRAGGVQELKMPGGSLLMEMNPQAREGGYRLAPGANSPLWVNGRPIENSQLSPGLEVRAFVNPRTQTLWKLQGTYTNSSGVLKQVDPKNHKLVLMEGDKTFQVNPQAVVAFVDSLVEVDPANAPFGKGEAASLDQLMPGMSVSMIVTPSSGEVQYIAVRRNLIIGWVKAAEPGQNRFTLDGKDNNSYKLFPGAPVTRDGQEASLSQLSAGDYIEAVLLPQTDTVVSLTAFSKVTFGRVLFVSEREKSLQLLDYMNRFSVCRFNDKTEFYRWGLPVSSGSLTPGSMVRVTLDSKEEIRRLVMAEVSEQVTKTLAFGDELGYLFMTDGTVYTTNSQTLITRGGYKIGPGELMPGDRLTITALKVPRSSNGVTAAITVDHAAGVAGPNLKVTAWKQAEGYVLGGTTSGEKVFVYLPDGSRLPAPVGPDGGFSIKLDSPKEDSVQVVAYLSDDLAVTSRRVNLYQVDGFGFSDTDNHWAKRQIAATASRGLVSGYPDGRFNPQRMVTRAEAVSLLVRLSGWEVDDNDRPEFSDASTFPAWAAASIATAQKHGLVKGYADGSFHPDAPVNRAEVAVMVDNYLKLTDTTAAEDQRVPPASYQDRGQIPGWALAAVDRLHWRKVMNGEDGNVFVPSRSTSRAEMAVLLFKLTGE